MLVLSLVILYISYAFSEYPVVTIQSGQIRGTQLQTQRNGNTFYAYLGIPYAAPPVGNLRFQPPQPVDSWDDIIDAKTNLKVCYQVGIDNSLETEDCLYINVYTPAAPQDDANLPVLFNIYGGAFIQGYNMLGFYRPEYIIEQDVIVVTINYRVGPFGFLSTGDAVIPGNMGLKDQQFALKWVQDNIKSFGGDPSKVTIIGQSAGAASVTYQILSPGSAGLFRGAIGESASALCTWAYQRQAVDRAYGIAAEIDSTFNRTKSTEELSEFLLSVDAKSIDNTADKYYVFAPVIEVEHEGAFITESMYEAVANGTINKVPLVIGMNSEEEILKAANLTCLESTARIFDIHLLRLADDDMYIEDGALRSMAGYTIRSIYTDGIFETDLASLVQYYSDNRFVRPIMKYAELQSAHTNVYFYQFSYSGTLGGNNVSIEGAGKVAHGEDMNYLWSSGDGANLNNYPTEDVTTLDRYVKLFTNFVKTLNPTPENSELLQYVMWPTVSSERFSYLDIDENLEIKENPREFSYSKWDEIYERFAKKPYISF